MLDLLKKLREKVVIGFVGGSDLPKITEQLLIPGKTSGTSLSTCHRMKPLIERYCEHSSGRFRLLLRRERTDGIQIRTGIEQ